MSLASKTSCSVKILELGQRARNIPPDGLYECSEMWKILYDLIVILKYTTRQYMCIYIYIFAWNWKYPNKSSNVSSCKSMSKPSSLVNQSVPRPTVEFFYLLPSSWIASRWDAHNQQKVLTPEVCGHFWWVPRPLKTAANGKSGQWWFYQRNFLLKGSLFRLYVSVQGCTPHTILWLIPGMSKWLAHSVFFHSHLSLQKVFFQVPTTIDCWVLPPTTTRSPGTADETNSPVRTTRAWEPGVKNHAETPRSFLRWKCWTKRRK